MAQKKTTKTGRKGIPAYRRPAMRQRIAEVVADLGGKTKAAARLAISVRSIEGWLSPDGTGMPDTNAVYVFAEELLIEPRWLLFGSGPKYIEVRDDDLAEIPNDIFLKALGSRMWSAMRQAGHDDGYITRYLPAPEILERHLIKKTVRTMRKVRQFKRIALANAIDDALVAGCSGGYAPQLAQQFAAAFHVAKGGTNPPGKVVVDPIFSVAVTDGDHAYSPSNYPREAAKKAATPKRIARKTLTKR